MSDLHLSRQEELIMMNTPGKIAAAEAALAEHRAQDDLIMMNTEGKIAAAEADLRSRQAAQDFVPQASSMDRRPLSQLRQLLGSVADGFGSPLAPPR